MKGGKQFSQGAIFLHQRTTLIKELSTGSIKSPNKAKMFFFFVSSVEITRNVTSTLLRLTKARMKSRQPLNLLFISCVSYPRVGL